MYIGEDSHEAIYLASEMKALMEFCTALREFPPGTYQGRSKGTFVKWYTPAWERDIPIHQLVPGELRVALAQAVERQLMGDTPIGLLLSGGLDSSLIASITSTLVQDKQKPLHSFSIGLKGSPDLMHARKAAAFLHTQHHEVTYTLQEGIDALRDVIYHIESFDITTVRASTPMYLLARQIRREGIKVVLSGEGADELFGGYLYFHMAPDPKEFHEETVRKLSLLSKYDCLRANKSMAAWGVETRVPFLDQEFVESAMGIDPRSKMCPGKIIEKKILREEFEGYLPHEILWRQKEQFSDGVGYGWIDGLKAYAEKRISDEQMAHAQKTFPRSTPTTKEGYLYRQLFEELFPKESAVETVPTGPTVACSTPTALRWSAQFQSLDDPSGRTIRGIHVSTRQ
jgi:asparagine synthase (glutamine-hydrolysing)